MSSQRLPIEEHPDVAEMRGRYERIQQKPALQIGTGLTVLAGLFVALSPWIAGFPGSANLPIVNLVVGLTAVVLALGFASSFRSTHGLSWVVPLLGVWTIIAPWVVDNAPHTSLRVILCNVLGGAVMLLLSLAVVGFGMLRRNAREAEGRMNR